MQSPRIAFDLLCARYKVLVAALGANLAVPLVLGGCVSAGTPPESWPTPVLAESDACPDLSGTYENSGATAKGNNATPLALVVLPEADKNWTASQVSARDKVANASHVRFYGPRQSGMKIEVWHGTDLIERIERGGGLGDGFSCEGGALRVSLPATGQAVAGVFFDTFKSAMVMRASDGSLLVKTSSLGVGLGFYVIPLAAGMEGMAHYKTVDISDSAKRMR